MRHNKESFVREYCLARKIPYRLVKEQLYVDGNYCCYNVYNLTYADLLVAIDNMITYDELTTDFSYLNWRL